MDKNIVPATPSGSTKPAQPNFRHKLQRSDAADAHVVVPDAVDIPLPKPSGQQISVPASINGRDLSDGRP
ncbi:MAG: hypothetical protein JWM58_4505 [Rhizobium sp.]|nr:hypothetical protein [Rhizobium sp.]